ncbi:unnamed protein product [Owenia fusiformis]|uniref:Uncharacterized protein n=1 Tax=Owenia fusiformis TaxID=6347 RepID=A0A8J1THW4_OWEFU|nr:unnamed protein product [Owenia fusiformis]
MSEMGAIFKRNKTLILKWLGSIFICYMVYINFEPVIIKLREDAAQLDISSFGYAAIKPTSHNQGGSSREDKQPHTTASTLRSGDEICPMTRLHGATKNMAQCRRIKPLKGSCNIANELFRSKPPDTCEHQTHHEICKLQVSPKDGTTVSCDGSKCAAPHELGSVNEDTGELIWERHNNIADIEIKLLKMTSQSYTKRHYGYCYIRCKPNDGEHVEYFDENYDTDWSQYTYQLLVLPPQLYLNSKHMPTPQNKESPINRINLNIMLLDSVSHNHFYRSLPKTIKKFNHINIHRSIPANVLDFRKMQAIKSRTYESLQALFSGEVYLEEKPFAVLDLPPRPLKTEDLFVPFKNAGYQTLWLEDLCWEWEWGITKNLRVHNKSIPHDVKWRNLQKVLEKSGIDALDLTHASCEILQLGEHPDPFHGPDVLCFNGKFQHEYILEYLTMYQSYLSKDKSPHVIFWNNNIAHEDTQRRVQTLDEHLSRYVDFLVTQQNTLSIIVADHGNAYGQFLDQSAEGRVEMFHPSLFMIIPDTVAKIIGPTKMKALYSNQDKLITMLDLHYMLQYILSLVSPLTDNPEKTKIRENFSVNPSGLFSPISANRSCSDLPMLRPNMCICQGYESTVANDSSHILLAEFALGELNNVISKQYRAGHPHAKSGFGACQRLVAHSFTNVKESHEKDRSKITKFDLNIKGPQFEEVFFVAVKTKHSSNFTMELLTFERMSKYSHFSKCADTDVKLPLCICDINQAQPIKSQDFSAILSSPPYILQTESEIFTPEEISGKCLHVITRRYKQGANFEIYNSCNDKGFNIGFSLKTENMEITSEMPVEKHLLPGDVTFLVVAIGNSPKVKWSWKYSMVFAPFNV